MPGRRICAWCGCDLGPAPDIEGETTGMCQECYEREMARLDEVDEMYGEYAAEPSPPVANDREGDG